MYTCTELRHIHRSFGHSSVFATMELKGAQGDNPYTATRKFLYCIEQQCSPCILLSVKPRYFKLTIVSRALRFNDNAQVDTMFLDGKPVVHMVYEATPFTEARFVSCQSAAAIWKAIQQMWSPAYMGPPDHISVNQASDFHRSSRATSRTAQECLQPHEDQHRTHQIKKVLPLSGHPRHQFHHRTRRTVPNITRSRRNGTASPHETITHATNHSEIRAGSHHSSS